MKVPRRVSETLSALLAGLGVMLMVWIMGWQLPIPSVLAGVATVLVVRWADEGVGAQEVEWPEAGESLTSAWSLTEPLVRRWGRAVEVSGQRDVPELRTALHAELCRRLVARHGADPADPLAVAPGLVPDGLLRAATQPGRLSRRQLDLVLDQLEEL